MDSSRLPLVIGYGNPLRSDDGLGRQVAQLLDETIPASVAAVIAAHQLTPELAEPISRASKVVFVDAREDGTPGRVQCQGVAPADGTSPTFSHDLDPPSLLGLARGLYGASPPAVIVSISGADFGYGLGLSTSTETALPSVVRQVHGIVMGETAPDPATEG